MEIISWMIYQNTEFGPFQFCVIYMDYIMDIIMVNIICTQDFMTFIAVGVFCGCRIHVIE